MEALLYISAAVVAYLVAGWNPAITFSKAIYKKDIRTCGSGNPGFTNSEEALAIDGLGTCLCSTSPKQPSSLAFLRGCLVSTLATTNSVQPIRDFLQCSVTSFPYGTNSRAVKAFLLMYQSFGLSTGVWGSLRWLLC